ncbi:hypothetical protein QBC38DRAFT_481986 [Podospora fimiseda]|uniref:Uncharacterized protein n=1 Tax=Podospora fimiseda TaxID=252190 RepID=A0AAN7GWM6_9PEZI|nr:hypothetical protein QBC38DRAFT_481986 [Podospora fimiseda]
MTFLSNSPLPTPEVSNQLFSKHRNIRRRQATSSIISTSLSSSPQIQAWGASPTSSQILIQGSFATRHTVRDFAVDAIDLISEANIPVIRALDTKKCPTEDFDPMDILKYLASQLLKDNQSLQTEKAMSLSAARFESTRTERKWFSLLGSVLEGMGHVYVIVGLWVIGASRGRDHGVAGEISKVGGWNQGKRLE